MHAPAEPAVYNPSIVSREARLARTFAASALFLLIAIAPAAAQPAGPYVAGHVGASTGDGGAALLAGASIGYMSPRRVAFELDISVAPELDFPSPPIAILAIFPAPTYEATGRLVWFQTNAVTTLVNAGKLRAAVVAGGGVVNQRRTVNFGFPVPTPLFTFATSPLPVVLPPYPRENTSYTTSESALALNAGGIVDYAIARRLRVGVDARYTHGFFYEPWKSGRVAARVQWQF